MVSRVRLTGEPNRAFRGLTVTRDAVLLDAIPTGLRVIVGGVIDAAAPADTVFGCAVSARLLRVALDALPEGDVEVRWGGRFHGVSLHVGEVVAVVMPMRCCSHGASMVDRGVFWRDRVRHECPCRDCAAGRERGWQ